MFAFTESPLFCFPDHGVCLCLCAHIQLLGTSSGIWEQSLWPIFAVYHLDPVSTTKFLIAMHIAGDHYNTAISPSAQAGSQSLQWRLAYLYYQFISMLTAPVTPLYLLPSEIAHKSFLKLLSKLGNSLRVIKYLPINYPYLKVHLQSHLLQIASPHLPTQK